MNPFVSWRWWVCVLVAIVASQVLVHVLAMSFVTGMMASALAGIIAGVAAIIWEDSANGKV